LFLCPIVPVQIQLKMTDEDGREALHAIENMVVRLVAVKKANKRSMQAAEAATVGVTTTSDDELEVQVAASAGTLASEPAAFNNDDAESNAMATELMGSPRPQASAAVLRYRAMGVGVVRAGSSMSSAEVGRLEAGEILTVLQTVEDENIGGTRVKFDRGWVSVTARSGKPLLIPVGEAAAVVPAAAVHLPAIGRTTSVGGTTPGTAEKEKVTAIDMLPQGIGLFDATLGKQQLQLQPGGMGLVVFKGGRPVETLLYTTLSGWEATKKGLQVEKVDGTVSCLAQPGQVGPQRDSCGWSWVGAGMRN
jgi:hypothetical protein